MRREMGARNFSTQYLQDPTPPEGNIVRLEWFPRYDEPPPRERCLKIIQSWDTAASIAPNSAYSVCTTWGYFEGRWYLLDVLRDRYEYFDLKRVVIRMHRLWKPDQVLVEDASTGSSLAAEFRAEGAFRVLPCTVSGSKEDRLIGQTGQLEAGKVVLPHEAPWLDVFCREITAAPNCRYWDQVDSMTQFLDFALSRKGYIDAEYDPKRVESFTSIGPVRRAGDRTSGTREESWQPWSSRLERTRQSLGIGLGEWPIATGWVHR